MEIEETKSTFVLSTFKTDTTKVGLVFFVNKTAQGRKSVIEKKTYIRPKSGGGGCPSPPLSLTPLISVSSDVPRKLAYGIIVLGLPRVQILDLFRQKKYLVNLSQNSYLHLLIYLLRYVVSCCFFEIPYFRE